MLIAPFVLDAYITEAPTNICSHIHKVLTQEGASGMSGIDCVYLINLDERQDRLESVYKEFSPYALNINRVSAVNGWKLPKKVFEELAGPYGVRISPGHTGCLLSHMSILYHAYQAQWEVIWVLEDDATILQDISCIPGLIEELNAIDPNWDVLFTDTDYRKAESQYIRALATNTRPDQPVFQLSYYTRKIPISPNLVRIYNRYGTTSMILSKRGIEKLFNYFTHVYIWQPIDIDMHYVPNIREYTTSVDVISNSLSSDSNTSYSIE